MNINLCTYFDKNYLSKFLTCRESIIEHEKNVIFYCLCIDDFSYNYLKQFNKKDIQLISLKEIEEKYLSLKYAKKNRQTVEYYFTLSPFLPLYILENFNVDIINYIDSDLYFFETPRNIINLLKDNSIIIVEHGIKTQRFGKFNVGWLTFRNNALSKSCLKEWGNDCINWCYDYVEEEKYADQKYLDQWPKKFNKIKILSPSYNVAPWNVNNSDVKIKQKKLYINEEKLIFFHFHWLFISKKMFSSGFSIYNKKISKTLIKHLYKPYIKRLENVKKEVNVIETRIRNTIDNKNFKDSVFKVFKLLIKVLKIISFLDFYRK